MSWLAEWAMTLKLLRLGHSTSRHGVYGFRCSKCQQSYYDILKGALRCG